MANTPEPAEIEIIEKLQPGTKADKRTILPNEIRINGHPVLASAEYPVVVHEMPINSSDVVRVTLTLFARRVTIASEEQES